MRMEFWENEEYSLLIPGDTENHSKSFCTFSTLEPIKQKLSGLKPLPDIGKLLKQDRVLS